MLPGSLSTDLSPEEIQKKLHELLQENLELKGNICSFFFQTMCFLNNDFFSMYNIDILINTVGDN